MLAAALAGLASAQDKAITAPLPRQDVTALRARIARLPAATVVMTAPDTKSLTPSMSPAGQPSASPTLSPRINAVQELPQTLRLSEVRFVPLNAEVEARSVQQVQRQVTGPVAVFEGAIRTLAIDREELTLKAVVLSGSPLRYLTESRHFEGTLKVGVVALGIQAPRQLSKPILFEVIGSVATKPKFVTVKSTAPPYQTITVISDSADEPVDVQVVSNVTPEGVKLTIPVQPALFVRVTPSRIQGWGLETADVLVQSRALGPKTNRRVQLSTDGGIVTPTEISLSTEGTGTASIRSVSTGKADITVSGPAFPDAPTPAPVEFLFPLHFIAAGILGGLAGGALRLGVPRRGAGRRTLAKLGLAVICGAIVFALYALGANVIGFQLPGRAGELVVFVVSALGALGGVGLLKPSAPPKP